jgi:hypothetical protein
VAPQQLFLRLGGAALAPFAWEVPGQFVGQLVLLKQLGVKEEPRAEDLVGFFSENTANNKDKEDITIIKGEECTTC